MHKSYNKPPLIYQDQLQQLKSRGLIIKDENYFLHLLEVKSYYRLSAYWLHSIVYFRNVCAHHSRLWNRVMSIQPLIPRKTRDQWLNENSHQNNRTFFLLSMLIYFMNTIKQENDVVLRVKQLYNKYPNIDPKAMGFPENWEDEPLWK